MSTTIDERVVSMQFDNKQFERNIGTSVNSLEKLKQSLNLTGAAKGLESISNAAKTTDMSGLASGVESVRVKFSALQVMAVTALSNITTQALSAGQKLASAFTTEPIKAGLQEYETQINAVQTILANTESKGTTLDQVNSALDELNKYADLTIYNFTEMTRNIGTFTAAGIDLDTSVSAIQGIANLAAVSGSNSQQASTAMYQLSQALAAGTVKLMDWNSVVNAGMGGQVFQDALRKTSEQLNTGAEAAIKAEGSFRESLSTGWLTSEVLTETLKKFTKSGANEYVAEYTGLSADAVQAALDSAEAQYGEANAIEKASQALAEKSGKNAEEIKQVLQLATTAQDAATKVKTFSQLMDTLKEAAQSGWTQTWEILIGDFEEAKELWTSVSDVFGDIINTSSEARNTMLEGAMTSNWDKLLEKIEEAGIETSTFEDKLKTVLEEQGYSVDKMIEKHGSLEEAFKSGAVNSDHLRTAIDSLSNSCGDLLSIEQELSKGSFGEDVTKIQEALKSLNYDIGSTGADGIFGKSTEAAVKAFQEAQGLEVTGIIDQSTLEALDSAAAKTNNLSASVDDLISGITKLGGRELLIESVKNAFEALKNIVTPIREAFREVFPPATSEQLYSVIERINSLTESFKEITEKHGPQIKSTFHGIFSAVDIGITVIKEVVNGIAKLIGNFTGLGGGILGITSSIGEWISGLRAATKETDIIGSSVDKVTDSLQRVIDKIKEYYGFLKEKIAMPGWEGFLSIMGAIWDIIQKIGKKVAEVGSAIGDALANAFRSGDINGALDILNSGIFTGILLGINKYIKGITDAFDDSSVGILDRIKNTFENLSGVFDSLGESLQAWQQNLKANVLLKIAGAIAILAAAILIIATIDPEKLAASLGTVTVLFADLMGSMAIFDKMGGTYQSTVKAVMLMIGMAIAVTILASALQKIAELDTGKMYNSILGITLLTAIIVAAAKAMSNNSEQMIKGSGSLVILALAVKVLASAVKDLSTLSWAELAKGLVAVGALLAGLAAFLNLAKFDGKTLATALGLLVLAAAIKLLASACKDFANMSWEEIAKGLVAVGVLLAEVALFAHFTKDVKNLLSTAIAMVIIAAAMKVFASAMADFGAMSWEEIAKGLVSIAASLAIVAIAVNNMPKNMISTGAGLLIVSAALLVVAEAVSRMGSMTWEGIAKGLITLAGSIAILAIGLNAMTGTLGGSAALLVASAAIVVLASALNSMGSMTWEGIAKGLVALAGAFTIIGVAALVLGPLTGTIIALGAGIALIGVGVLTAGAGLMALAAGFTSLAVAGAAGATAIVASLTIIITGIIALIPAIMVAIGEGIIDICGVITEGAPAIAEAVKAIVLSLIDVLVECVPAIAEGALELISGVLAAIATYTPQIVDSLMTILISFINGIADRLPELIQAGANLIGAFFEGITSVLQNVDSTTLLNTIVSVGVLAALMVALGAIAGLVPSAMVGVLALGALIVELGLVLAAIGALAQIPGLEWLVSEGGDFLQTVGTAIGKFLGGIIGGVAQGITSALPQIGSDLSAFMQNADPFITGAKAIDSSMMTGVKALAETIVILTGASIIEGLTSWFSGGSSLADFGAEIADFGPHLAAFASSVAGIDGEAVRAAAEAAKTLAEMANTVPNEGGIAAWFAGENSLASFGSQIVAFGVSLKAYAIAVAGIDVAAVTASTEAGKALVEMANTVPNQGGIVAWFAGENSLAAFGSQIVAFGVSLKAYATAVAGIDVASVTASTEAGKALTDLANNVPNEGGIAAWFAGENSIAAFGDDLVVFGESMKSYADAVAGIDTAAIAASVTAAASLVALSTTIPEDKLFKNETTLSEFGRMIAEYGGHLLTYCQQISGIDIAVLSSAITQTGRLVEMAKGMVGLDTSGMSSFSVALTALGQAGIDGFIIAFTNAVPRATAAIDTLINGVTTTVNSKQAEFNTAAQSLIQYFVTGITVKTPAVTVAITTIINAILKLVEKSYTKFNSSGKESMAKFIDGVDSKTSDASNSMTKILGAVIQKIKDYYDDAKTAGQYLVDGFCAGIDENTFKAQARAAAMARAALDAAEEELDVESPSKEFYDIGDYSVDGFVNALIDGSTTAYDAGASIASAAKTGLSNAIAKIADTVNSGVDLQPTISPVLDLSDVESGVGLLSSMFGLQPSVGVLATVGSINSSMNRNQNGANDDVVSAINGLKDAMAAASGDTYTVNGITYDDGSNITESVKSLIRAARVERRV